MKKILLALLLLARCAQAQIVFTFPPCDPVFLAGPEGRPIPNATVQFTNPDGSLPTNGVWLNYTGTTPFDNRIPANQILQVFADAGIYRVQVSGAGITKSYYTRCSVGVGEGLRKVSVDRTPDLLLLNTSSPPTLDCPLNQHCTLAFDQGNIAIFDFVMPSFLLTLNNVLLTFQTAESTINIAWSFNWCVYNVGQVMCNPTTAGNKKIVIKTVNFGQDVRQDVLFTGAEWSTLGWVPNAHVVFALEREFGGDTGSFPAFMQNIRLEFDR